MNLINNQKMENTNLINSPKFAYLYGYFVADGSYYKDSSGTRFEFSDGTSIKEELMYSFKFINRIRVLFEDILQKEISEIRKRENRYVLSFRSKKLDSIFRYYFNISTGEKSFSIAIPNIYVNTTLEKYFWLGVLDGDGMVARKNRKVSLESGSKKLIDVYKDFLVRKNIIFRHSERILNSNKFYRVDIKSNFFKKFCSEIGFFHPRKKLWLLRHLKLNDFYKNNIINTKDFTLKEGIIDYEKLFKLSNVMIVNGKYLLKKHGLNYKGRKNRKFSEILQKFASKNISKIRLFKILSKYRWKMSKGSTNSIKIPLHFNPDILEIAKFIRLTEGNVKISRNYIKSYNIIPETIIEKMKKLFDIKPNYTSKREPIFCSGVLAILFSKIIKNGENEQVILPKWHQNLE